VPPSRRSILSLTQRLGNIPFLQMRPVQSCAGRSKTTSMSVQDTTPLLGLSDVPGGSSISSHVCGIRRNFYNILIMAVSFLMVFVAFQVSHPVLNRSCFFHRLGVRALASWCALNRYESSRPCRRTCRCTHNL
jgi:hypothetical protein